MARPEIGKYLANENQLSLFLSVCELIKVQIGLIANVKLHFLIEVAHH